MSDLTELAWAAGFFDGEGTTCHSSTMRTEQGLSNGPYVQLQVSVTQMDRRVLDRFHAAVGGVGRVYQLRARRGGLSQGAPFRWQTTSRAGGTQVIDALWPFLSDIKRQQATRSLMALDRAAYKRAARAVTRTAQIAH